MVLCLPIITGFFMIIGSVVDIQISIEMRRFQYRNLSIIIALGIMSIVLVFLLILNHFQGAVALMIYIGILLIIWNIWNIYCISKVIRMSEDDMAIDVEWHSAD